MLCEQGRTGIKDADGKLNCWIEEVEGFPIYVTKTQALTSWAVISLCVRIRKRQIFLCRD